MSSEASYPTAFRLTVVLTSLFFGSFLVAIDTTIVSMVIPKISTQFHALDDVGWYGSAYLITTTALQPAAGTLYRLFDAKTVYLAAIVVFEGMPRALPPQYDCLGHSSRLGSMCGCSHLTSFHIG